MTCCAIPILLAASVLQAQPTVNALLLAAHFKLDKRTQTVLSQAGIRVVRRKISDPLSPAMLRQFHLVVMGDCGGVDVPYFGLHEHMVNHYTIKQNIRVLHAYVAAGGGLYFQPMMGGAGIATSRSYRMLLDPWGVRIMPAQVRDNAKSIPEARRAGDTQGKTKRQPAFSWTESIAKHPVTQGVRRVYYPTNMLRWDDAYACNPLALTGKGWTVVVRGSPTSTAARGFQYTTWMPHKGGTAPPIAAVRAAGKGRVAVVGIHSFYTLFFPDYNAKDWIGESHTGVIGGIVLDRGDGTTPSDMGRLLVNTLRWLAQEKVPGTFCAKHPPGPVGKRFLAPFPAKLKPPPQAKVPAWLVGWSPKPGAAWHKVLIGARTAYSTGTGTVARYAAAARAAGYAILVITEEFEHLNKADWPRLVADCAKATDDRLVVLPGLEIPDAYGNRYLLFGQHRYPEAFMLTEDGRAMRWIQNFMLGFSDQMPAVARPGSTPIPHQLLKHYCGIAVYTYRNGKLVDNGMPAYMWQAFRLSYPLPLVVHEITAPDQIASEATTGHQLHVLADTPASAAWYMRHGHKHFFENTPHFQITAGPRITVWETAGQQVRLTVEGDVPLREVRLMSNFNLTRRWLPKGKTFAASTRLNDAQLQQHFIVATDTQGRTAISSVGKTGDAAGYRNRCSDRQNWIGFHHLYTGTRLADVDIRLGTFGTDEGRGLWAHARGPLRGENLCLLLDYPLVSRAADVIDVDIDQRYYRAVWLETVFDAKPPHDTARSRVFRARVRDWTFPGVPARLQEIEVTLRRPVEPAGAIFPGVTRVARHPACAPIAKPGPQWKDGRLVRGHYDLAPRAYAGDLVALDPGLRVLANGHVGFVPGKGARNLLPTGPAGCFAQKVPGTFSLPLPAGTTWRVRYVRATKPEKMPEVLRAMGLSGPLPYGLKLTVGKLQGIDLVARASGPNHGVSGQVTPGKIGHTLPVFVAGLNDNWPAGVWRPGEKIVPVAVFERTGIARLDVSRGGPFFIGNLVRCDAPALHISIAKWTAKRIELELHNPTARPLTTTVETAREIVDRLSLSKRVTVPGGTTVPLSAGR